MREGLLTTEVLRCGESTTLTVQNGRITHDNHTVSGGRGVRLEVTQGRDGAASVRLYMLFDDETRET